jgi:hypothetical protein
MLQGTEDEEWSHTKRKETDLCRCKDGTWMIEIGWTRNLCIWRGWRREEKRSLRTYLQSGCSTDCWLVHQKKGFKEGWTSSSASKPSARYDIHLVAFAGEHIIPFTPSSPSPHGTTVSSLSWQISPLTASLASPHTYPKSFPCLQTPPCQQCLSQHFEGTPPTPNALCIRSTAELLHPKRRESRDDRNRNRVICEPARNLNRAYNTNSIAPKRSRGSLATACRSLTLPSTTLLNLQQPASSLLVE